MNMISEAVIYSVVDFKRLSSLSLITLWTHPFKLFFEFKPELFHRITFFQSNLEVSYIEIISLDSPFHTVLRFYLCYADVKLSPH